MTGRERVLSAINRQQPDRIPAGFSAMECVRDRLMAHVEVNTYKELLDHLHVDIFDIRGVIDPDWKGPFSKNKVDGNVVSSYLGWRTEKVKTVYGEIEEHLDGMLEKAERLEDIDAFPWPEVDWFDFSSVADRLKEYDGYAVMASGASIYQHPAFNRGIENLLCDLLTAPELAVCMMDHYVDFYLQYYTALIEASDGRIDILRIADDLGMQDRILISPELFMEYIKPRLFRFTEMAHSYGVKVMFHSCGDIIPFIDEIIETGVDILDPIQTTAAGMNPAILKERFGKKICFHGSIDTQYTLPQGSTESVRNELDEMAATLGKGGGFIAAPSHILQPDVPLENIIALYEGISKKIY